MFSHCMAVQVSFFVKPSYIYKTEFRKLERVQETGPSNCDIMGSTGR